MQFVKTVQLQGDSDKYSVSPDIKRYTLIDLGFEETKRGNFEYVGSVDTDNPFNLFTHPRAKEFVEQYHFILKEMLKRNVFLVTKG